MEEMTHEERSLIKDLEKCDFGEIHAMHVAKVEARRNMSKEEKLVYLHSFSHEMRDVLFFWRVTARDCGRVICSVGFERGQREDPGRVRLLPAGPPQGAHRQL